MDKVKLKELAIRLRKVVDNIRYTDSFFSYLLLHTELKFDLNTDTAYTDGNRLIAFSPDFLDKHSELGIRFVLLHEVMHIALQHPSRSRNGGFQHELYNIAADIVINSTIFLGLTENEVKSLFEEFGDILWKAPDEKPGCNYTTEEVYYMLLKNLNYSDEASSSSIDSHDSWESDDNTDGQITALGMGRWKEIVKKAEELANDRTSSNYSPYGTYSKEIGIMLKEDYHSVINYADLLKEFICKDELEYSYKRPSRRHSSDSDILFPSLCRNNNIIRNLLYMVDVSGSMSDEMVTDVLQEIKYSIEKSGLDIEAYYGLFNTEVFDVKSIDSYTGLSNVEIKTDGGTDFSCIFEYLKNNSSLQIDALVILTDGYAPYPRKEDATGVEVFWLLNNNEAEKPGWGTVAVYKEEK